MLSLDQVPALALLGLEAFAAADAIRKSATAIAMRERLAGNSTGHGDAVRRAAESLADPISWLEDSMRWLILPSGSLARGGFEPHEFLSGPSAELARLVEQASSPGFEEHNTAVLQIAKALHSGRVSDAVAAMKRLGESASPSRTPTRGTGAPRTLTQSGSNSWIERMLRSSTEQRPDPRINETVLARIRDGYADRLLGPLLELHRGRVSAMTSSDVASLLAACAHLDTKLGRSGVATRAVLGGVLERVAVAVKGYESKLEGAATDAALRALAREVQDHLDVDAGVLVSAREHGGSECTRVRDEYASLLRSIAIRAFNRFNSFDLAEVMLGRAQGVAATDALRAQLKEDARIADEGKHFGQCAYCRSSAADGTPRGVAMFRVTERHLFSRSVSYQSLEVPIPRCKACAGRHASQDTTTQFVFFGLVFVGAIVGLVMSNGSGRRGGDNWVGGCCGGIIVGGIAGLIVSWIVGAVMSGSERGGPENFEPVRKLLADGWKIGDKPGRFD